MPVWENIPEYQKAGGKEDLYLVTFKWNVLTSSMASNKWLSEIVHDNPLWMNPETARELGIQKGDKVKITGPVGTIETKVRLTHGIHPKVVAMSGQLGHWGMGRVAKGEKFVSQYPDTKLVWWKEQGAHPNSLMAQSMSPLTGAQAWQDNKVKVAKV